MRNDDDWVKRCITWEVEGIRQRGRPKKTWWDCVKNDMESLGLSQRMRSSRINGEGELRGQPAKPSLPGKMAVKMVCVLYWENLAITLLKPIVNITADFYPIKKIHWTPLLLEL